jgi:hypothetical protein
VNPAVIFRDEQTKERAIQRIRAIRPDQENPLAMFIGPYKKIRTLEQNALYWRLIDLVSRATGHSRDVLHLFFKKRAFGYRLEQIGKECFEFVPSSAKATRGDFNELVEHVQAFIAEYNIGESA